jgi:hypothetical protein
MAQLLARTAAAPWTIHDPAPRAGYEWILGSEPISVCFSCDSTFPQDSAKCPVCDCPLSIVRRCPSCRRILSAQHSHCIYCSTSFLRRGFAAFRPMPFPVVRRVLRFRPRPYALALEVGIILALVAVSGLFLYTHFKPSPRAARQTQSDSRRRPTQNANRRHTRRAGGQSPQTADSTLNEGGGSAAQALPLPPPPPLKFTIVGGYVPPPLLRRD